MLKWVTQVCFGKLVASYWKIYGGTLLLFAPGHFQIFIYFPQDVCFYTIYCRSTEKPLNLHARFSFWDTQLHARILYELICISSCYEQYLMDFSQVVVTCNFFVDWVKSISLRVQKTMCKTCKSLKTLQICINISGYSMEVIKLGLLRNKSKVNTNSIFTGAPIKFSNSKKAPQGTQKTKIPVWVLVHVMSKLNFMSKLNPKMAHCLLTVIDLFWEWAKR